MTFLLADLIETKEFTEILSKSELKIINIQRFLSEYRQRGGNITSVSSLRARLRQFGFSTRSKPFVISHKDIDLHDLDTIRTLQSKKEMQAQAPKPSIRPTRPKPQPKPRAKLRTPKRKPAAAVRKYVLPAFDHAFGGKTVQNFSHLVLMNLRQ